MTAPDDGARRPLYATRGLVDALLEMAADAEPEALSVVLASTPAKRFDGDVDGDLGVEPETAVLTHFYLPDVGGPVRDVFGVDLGTPAGRGRARFVSHPQGPAEPTERDDFAAAVLLSVPPWEAVRAFDRGGRRLDLVLVDAEPPRESLA